MPIRIISPFGAIPIEYTSSNVPPTSPGAGSPDCATTSISVPVRLSTAHSAGDPRTMPNPSCPAAFSWKV